MKERYMGAVVRSREKLVERDEQPSKLFQFFEKQRIKCNTIRQIKDENGQSVSTQEEISDVFYEEYVRTFQNKNACDGRLAESMLQQLQKEVSEEVRERTNTEIVESEIRRAIRKMPPNKSPGPDGIGAAFYKKFLDQLAPLLQKVFKDIFKRKLLPPTMRQSLVVLIPKPHSGNDIPSVSNFRPISLLCTDYKVLTRILARRLERGIAEVVGDHQTYAIKSRSIAHNLHAMRTVCEAAEAFNTPLAVLQIDLSRAFDRV